MSTSYYIALDVHQSFCEMAVMTTSGKLIRRDRCATTIPALSKALEAVRRPRYLTFEEGPLAAWLTRNLDSCVDQLIVCDPRRNHLIAKDGDKDDPLDAEKLAQLFRGGYLKPVHQPENQTRAILKQHIGFYHDRVRERVRAGNQLLAQFRRHGVFLTTTQLQIERSERTTLYKRLPSSPMLQEDIGLLWDAYDLLCLQEDRLRLALVRAAHKIEVVRRFLELPGIAEIRALTFYAYLDAPFRFATKTKLWRYCGIGLERRHSGSGPTSVRLSMVGHRKLKSVLLGAARSAIAQAENPFAEKHQHWIQEHKCSAPTARRNVARAMATTLWSLWKHGHQYDPQRVR